MAKLPESAVTLPTVLSIYAQYAQDRGDWRRPHLGASQIGKECDRALFYQFRWSTEPTFDGRMLRLFSTGDLEEIRLVKDLRSIGIEVYEHDPNTGKQFRVSEVGGHFAGSMDGCAKGFQESSAWHVLEFKTSNAKGFAKLKKIGVEESRPEHFAQMQVYMHLTGMERAFYLCVCKDTDEIWGERVRYHAPTALRLIERARRIIAATEPPSRISDNPDAFACKWCDHKEICHEGRVPLVSCRTCAHATPVTEGEGGRWVCERLNKDLTQLDQRRACGEHRFIPALLPVRAVDASPEENWIEYENGMRNGGDGMTSEEIREAVNR